jgi:hypothetical protein
MKMMKQQYRCAECDNQQEAHAFCQNCCGTVLFEIGKHIPRAGVWVESSGINLISLGEMDQDGGLRVSLPDSFPEYLGKVYQWKEREFDD